MTDVTALHGCRTSTHPVQRAGTGRGREVLASLAFVAIGLWIARPFIIPVLGGIIIAIAVWPLYRRCGAGIYGRHASAFLAFGFTSSLGLILILPLTLAASELATRAPDFARWVEDFQRQGVPVPPWLVRIPVAGPRIAVWWQAHVSNSQSAHNLLSNIDLSSLTEGAAAFVGSLAQTSVLFVLSLLVIYYVLRNANDLTRRCQDLAEWLFGPRGRRLTIQLAEATRGTVNGTVLVACGEGALIGCGYAISKVPEPILLSVLTIIAAMLPFGAWLVVAMAAGLLVLQGHGVAAMGLFAWGCGVMLLGDNVVQPKLIGGSVRLPFVLALIGVLGGTEAFGAVGLFMGPVVMSGILLMWHDEVEENEHPGGKTVSCSDGQEANGLSALRS